MAGNKVTRICENCSIQFPCFAYIAKRGGGRYCTRDCSAEFRASGWIKRFWSKVQIAGKDECWEWQAYRRKAGYGGFQRRNKPIDAHVVAFQVAYGPLPKGLIVRHKCDNPPCCNPEHLESGTYADNARDREVRGRANRPKGINHPHAKLNEIDVRAIRTRYASTKITYEALSREYGVTSGNIGCILRRESWAHI